MTLTSTSYCHSMSDRVPGYADLCCYWFEKAREQSIVRGLPVSACSQHRAFAVVLIVRFWSESRRSGDIFFAICDRDWVLDGANVHVSHGGL